MKIETRDCFLPLPDKLYECFHNTAFKRMKNTTPKISYHLEKIVFSSVSNRAKR